MDFRKSGSRDNPKRKRVNNDTEQLELDKHRRLNDPRDMLGYQGGNTNGEGGKKSSHPFGHRIENALAMPSTSKSSAERPADLGVEIAARLEKRGLQDPPMLNRLPGGTPDEAAAYYRNLEPWQKYELEKAAEGDMDASMEGREYLREYNRIYDEGDEQAGSHSEAMELDEAQSEASNRNHQSGSSLKEFAEDLEHEIASGDEQASSHNEAMRSDEAQPEGSSHRHQSEANLDGFAEDLENEIASNDVASDAAKKKFLYEVKIRFEDVQYIYRFTINSTGKTSVGYEHLHKKMDTIRSFQIYPNYTYEEASDAYDNIETAFGDGTYNDTVRKRCKKLGFPFAQEADRTDNFSERPRDKVISELIDHLIEYPGQTHMQARIRVHMRANRLDREREYPDARIEVQNRDINNKTKEKVINNLWKIYTN
jgi:hypothetical protein